MGEKTSDTWLDEFERTIIERPPPVGDSGWEEGDGWLADLGLGPRRAGGYGGIDLAAIKLIWLWVSVNEVDISLERVEAIAAQAWDGRDLPARFHWRLKTWFETAGDVLRGEGDALQRGGKMSSIASGS